MSVDEWGSHHHHHHHYVPGGFKLEHPSQGNFIFFMSGASVAAKVSLMGARDNRDEVSKSYVARPG